MTAITTPADQEQVLARELRDLALQQIEALGDIEAAERLQIAPAGVDALRFRSSWSLETAIRVAAALKLDVVDRLVSVTAEGSPGSIESTPA